MKHTLLALAFAVATLTACSSTKTCPPPVVTKEVKAPAKVCPKAKAAAKKAEVKADKKAQ